MFLMIGHTPERTFRRFVHYTWSQGVPAPVLDLALLRDPFLPVEIHESDGGLSIRLGKQVFDLNAYDAFYVRAYSTDLGNPQANATLLRLVRSLAAYLNKATGTIVNRPAAGMSNSNKFLHANILKAYGFRLPEAYLVGNPATARSLAAFETQFISKSCSGTKTRVVGVSPELWQRTSSLSGAPSQFQHYIAGADVRVHVVGDELLAERIESHRVDYRFNDESLPPNKYSICDVPPDVAQACLSYCADAGLPFAGIDFKVTSDEQWYVLEANPMPGYESYDRRQNSRISRALFDLLTSGTLTPAVNMKAFLQLRSSSRRQNETSPPFRAPFEDACQESIDDSDLEPFITESRRPVVTIAHHEEHLRPEDFWVMGE